MNQLIPNLMKGLVLPLLFFITYSVSAQNYPYVLGYGGAQSELHEGTAVGDTFSISYSGGAPFPTVWKPSLNGNFCKSGFRHNLIYVEQAFESDLFVSKGYYGDYVELKWDLDKYIDQVTAFKVYRKILGSSDDSVQVASLSADARRYQDEYAESGVIYAYTLVAEGLFPFYEKFVNYITGVGFRVPYGRISGRVTYAGGAAVPGVNIIAESEDDFGGYSVALDGTESYMVISPAGDDEKFEFDTAFTYQAWVKPTSTTLSSLFKKGSQYKLTHKNGELAFKAGTQTITLSFPEKVDTFFHVTAMRSADSLKLVLKYSDLEYYTASAKFTSTTPENTDEIFIGRNGTTTNQYFQGVIDEVRLWHRSFDMDEILDYSGMYIAGTEDYLSGYYRLNENVGDNFYDLSRQGFTFHENHGYLYKTSWSTEIPTGTQLAVKGITDSNGNYIISGIPYSTDGSIYRFIPVYDIHTFDPTEKLLFLGPGSTSHNNVDFIDIASFPVQGTVFYRDTYFPVEGVNIKIDGVTAVTSDGIPITSNAQGEFMIDVPIGKHYITIEKYGHGFVDNGRFPAGEGEYFDFQAPYTFQSPFVDTTLIKVIGRVVGGPVQGDKPKGLGKSISNIGTGHITLGTQKEYDLTDDAAGASGTWSNLSFFEGDEKDNGETQFEVVNTSPKQITIHTDSETGEFFAYLLPEKYIVKNVIAGSYTFGAEFNTTIDLTQAFLYQSETDTNSALGGNGELVTVTDSVQYQYNHDFVYRVSPELDVVNAETGEAQFWEGSIVSKDGTEVTIVDGTGAPLTDYPVFEQRGRYKIAISVFEKYINDDKGGIEDRVPVTDGSVEIQNALAIDQTRQLIPVNSQGVATYNFMGGMPNITQGGIGDYIKTMSIVAYTGKNGAIATPWLYNGDVFKAYVLGGLPTGNNFVTTGPNQVDMILRDPFGSTSYSYYEVGQSTSKTSTYSVMNENSGGADVTFQLGTEVTTFAGVGAGVIMTTGVKADATVGMEHAETWLDNETVISTNTTTKVWSTSAEPDFVGPDADVFIGHSTNIVYGKSIFLSLIKDCVTPECAGSDVGGYKIGKHTAIRVNPEFSTGFMYTANHIENYLIPNLEMLRNNMLENNPAYTSVLPVDDDNYGSNNSQGTNDSYVINIPPAWPDDSLFQDSIHFYNEQIKGWVNLLAQNEREKAEAVLETNYSFDGGVVYESSITTEESEEVVNTFEFMISPFIAGEFGAEFNKFGMTATFEERYTHVETSEEGVETAKSVTFGYELSDGDEGDYFSVDIKKPNSPTGPVFALKGGQSQCPYEGEVVTKYYSPGTVISESTQQREKPVINVTNPVQTGIPEDQHAVFEVLLGNISETDDDVWFVLAIDDESNQEGAEIRLDGTSIGNGRLIRVPAGSTIKKIVTVEKVKPDVFDYEDLTLVLHSACQYDPTDNLMDISDSVRVTARFQPVCSPVSMPSPADLWILNTNTGTDLPIEIGDYNLAHSSFENVQFQYKPSSTSQWVTDMTFYVDQDEFDAAQEPKTFIDGNSTLDYTWATADLKDREYNIRIVTNCADGTMNASETATGIRDIKRPEVFGTPQPADGILSPNDEIMITFDEPIQAGLLLSTNFSVRGVLNGAEIQHNSSLYFDGVDDYASVINGVNLENSDATVEFWVQRAGLGEGTILSIGQGIEIGFDATNKFYTTIEGVKVATPTSYTSTSDWIHFAVAYDHSNDIINMYVNDQWVIENQSVPHTDGWGDEIHIGTDFNNTKYSEMYMHDLRFWDSARGFGTTFANMSVVMSGAEIGLVGLWAMDESAGDYAPDKARSQNALLRGPQWRVFPSGYARTFAGNDAVAIPTGSSVVLDDEMDYTVEFWFKGASQSNSVLFSNGRGDNTDAAPKFEDIVVVGTDITGNLYVQNNGNVLTVSEDVMDNEWHHFAFIVNRRANASIYIDGNLQSFEQSDEYGGLNGAEMAIGARMQRSGATNIYDRYFNGKIDEFRIWGLARTSTLIDLDMNSKLSGDEVGLLAYYPFDAYSPSLVLEPTLADQVDGSALIASAWGGGTTNTDVPNIKDARPVQNLAFDWVVNGDELIINVNEQPQLIEKTVLEFTVRNVEDLQENRMASPVTWTAYIKKNTLIWGNSSLSFEKQLYEPMSFEVEVQNIGGVEQNFSIKNLPSWITPSQQSGTLLPDSKEIIEFVVDPSVNIGEYDISIYLGSDFGYNEKLEVKLNVQEETPEWDVNPSDYQYSMSLVGYIKVDGVVSTNPDDQVAAFVGNEVRGVANLEYIEDYDRYLVFLNIYSNAENGEDVYFRIWNAGEGIEHINITPEVQFVSNDLIGTPALPQLLETNNSYNNQIYLPQGWKWFSINLEDQDLGDVNSFLSDLSPANGDQIKGQQSFANFNEAINWNGSMSVTGLENEEMYLINLAQADTLEFSGPKVDVLNTPITIETGWNWVGYTPQVNIELNTALGNYEAKDGDVFKSQYAFAVYDDILGWIGNLNFLQPGEGYMFKTSNLPANLYYPENGMSSLRVANLRTSTSETQIPWTIEDSKYAFNMNYVATITGVTDEDWVVGAFVGDECRGYTEAKTYNVDGEDVVYYFITVYGESNDKITFKGFHKGSEELVDFNEISTFVTNGVQGTVDTPYPLGGGLKLSSISSFDSYDFEMIGYPNPFRESFTVELSRQITGKVNYTIVDVLGKTVATGSEELIGGQSFIWNGQGNGGNELPAGMYIITIDAGFTTKTISVVKI